MDYRLPPIILLLLAGCTAPAVQPPTTTAPEPPSGVFVTAADYEGSLALRFELNGQPGTNCTYRQQWVGWNAPGIDYFIIREGKDGYLHGGYSEHRQFVQIGDKVDTRDFSQKGNAFHAQLKNATITLEWRKEVYALVFGNLAHAAASPVAGAPTLYVGFDCHTPGSVKLLGAGTEVVPILIDRFNSTATIAVPTPAATGPYDGRVMVNGTLSATFQSPLVEVRLSGIPSNDLSQVTLTHPNGTEDWTVLPPVNYTWNHEFMGGPGTYALTINQAQGGSWLGVMMGFDAPERFSLLNVTAG